MPQQQEATAHGNLFSGYDLGVYYDEMFGTPGQPRPHYEEVYAAFEQLTPAEFEERPPPGGPLISSPGNHLYRL